MNRLLTSGTILISVVGIVVATACGSIGASGGPANKVARPTPAARETTVVKRGAITESLRFLGRVASVREAPLYFKSNGRLTNVAVQPGEDVKEGQLLAELDTADLPAKIEAAKVELETAILKLDQELAEKGDDPATRRANALKEAEADVMKAQATLQKAEAELKKIEAGPDPIEVAGQEAAVYQAEQALDEAREKYDKLKNGPTEDERRQLEAAVRDARAALEAAQVNRLVSLKDESVAKLVRDRENEHSWFEKAYGEAKEKFDAGQIDQLSLDYAYSNLLAAKERLDSARLEADAKAKQVDNAVAQAHEQLRKAEAELAEKTAPPEEKDLQAAERGVQAAVAQLEAARAKLADIKDGPTEADRLAAQGAVLTAQAALDKAKGSLAAKQAGGAVDFELQLLEKQVDQARVNLEELEAQLEGSRLVSPFDGKVTQARGRVGDQITAFQTLFVVSDPTDLHVRTELADTDLTKVAIGQRVELTVDAIPGTTLKGTVTALPSGLPAEDGAPPDMSVHVEVEWPQAGAELGMLARGQIIVQEKSDVLIVPVSAIKTVGQRRFVEYFDGKARRGQNVEVGIVTDSEAEILSGLEEGQEILVGQ